MKRPRSKHKNAFKLLRRILSLVFVLALCISIVQLLRTQTAYSTARDDYSRLHDAFAPNASSPSMPSQHANNATSLPATPIELNPDYAAWVEVPDTTLSYPVVQAQNNTKYLTLSFTGTPSPAGSIFMDSRNSPTFSSPHTLLYGHNLKDGSMFGSLKKYLDADYFAQNPTILINTPTQSYTYTVFAAREVDMYDASYRVDFTSSEDFAAFAALYGAPTNTQHILSLSTCTNTTTEGRILIHAALQNAVP